MKNPLPFVFFCSKKCSVSLQNNTVTDSFPPIPLKRERPAYQQIEGQLKRAIGAGKWPLGSSLPTVRVLAGQYGTSISTIQAALDALAGDGLIERARGRGTFVRQTVPRLNSVGIYFGRDFLHSPEMAYSRELCRLLFDGLEAKGIKYRFWADARPERRHGEPLEDLVKAVSKCEFQGLIVGEIDAVELSWLSRLGIPFAAHAETPRSRVNYDFDQMIKLGIEELKKQGCRSIGAILPIPGHSPAGPVACGDSSAMTESFCNWVSDFRLTTRNSWMRIPGQWLLPREHEQFGYEQFREIWRQPKRPDGLLVFPDTIVRGCVTAILESGVSVPEDLKLVLHRNEGIPAICPLPASWLVSDLRALASALIAQLERQIQGRPATPVFLPHALEPAESRQAQLRDQTTTTTTRKKK